MRKIPISVPRVFYLNSKAPVTEEFPGRRVNKILPHGHQSNNLIEVHLLNFNESSNHINQVLSNDSVVNCALF